MNIFKKCTQQPPEPSLWEDDVTVDNILSKLLMYFGGFQCLIEAKKDIETKCEMEKKEDYWSDSDIKKAWRERERMNKKKKSAIKHWSRVIVLEELRRRLYDDKCKRQAEADVKEDENTQACGNAPRKIGKSDEISFNTEPSIVSEERQIDNDYKQTRNNEEKVVINLVGANPKQKTEHIRIPLSFMSEDDATSIPDNRQNIESPYKLINGNPRLTNTEDSENYIIKNKSYVMSYNHTTNNANWVYEILNQSTLANNFKKVKSTDDYQNGHLAAAANHRWCAKAQEDASLLSNMAPQIKSLNKSMWLRLENHCRKLTKDKLVRNVHVYTGPCYLYDRKELKYDYLASGKALPTHFFKVIIVEDVNGKVDEPECYLIPNDHDEIEDEEYTSFKCKIKVIEKKSGLTFIDCVAKGTTAHIKQIKWNGIMRDKMGKGDNEGSYTAHIEVRIFS